MFNIVFEDRDTLERVFTGNLGQLPQISGTVSANDIRYKVIEIKSTERFDEYENLYIVSIRKI
jgi:hypothetical protein